MTSSVRCELSVQDDAVVVRLAGEADTFEADTIQGCLREAIDKGRPTVVLDLSQLTFIDSAMTRVLVQARAEAAGAHTTLVLAGPSRAVRRSLSWSAGGRTLPAYGSVGQAVLDHDVTRGASG